MRIAYLTPTFPPYPGGIGVNAFYNAAEMARRGHSVEVFTPRYGKRNNKTTEERENFKVHYLRPWFFYGNAALLPQFFWKLRTFDAVHVYYPFFGGAEMAAIVRSFSAFKLVIHHEMDVAGEGWLKKFFSWHTRRIFPWIIRQSDAVFTLSEDYFKHSDLGALYRAGGKSLPPWYVIPNGVDTDHFRPAGHLSPDPFLCFVAGLDRAHYFKGVSVLLDALSFLARDGFVARLRIAGEGDMKEEYRKLAESKGIEDRVEFVGLVKHDALPDFYRHCSLFVMPSVGRTESFSIATAEAQACGIPAIVSDLPGIRVTIENGVTGFTAASGDARDLANKIRSLLADRELAAKMGRAGRERMERMFSWKRIGDQLEKIYFQLINNKLQITNNK